MFIAEDWRHFPEDTFVTVAVSTVSVAVTPVVARVPLR